MRIVSIVGISPVLACFAIATAGDAQAPGDDSARSRAVHQAGSPSTTSNDALFQRAEQTVREGRGEAGRAVVDSVVARTKAGSPQHGQALYWRASLAADAAEAERGYRRVILEYPATPWAGDALVNLAQLEMARGDQEQSLMHLHRFEREYSSHESRARASLWLARLYFDRKNERRACASLATARLAASPDDVELRNQIDYYGQRCIGVDTASVTPRPIASAATTDVNAPTKAPAPAVEVKSPAAPPPAPESTAAALPTPTPSARPPVSPSAAEDATRGAQPITPGMDSVRRAQSGAGGYTVQIAAYDTRAAAEALIAKLKVRGYTARLATTVRPFRVRIGRYDTRADAVAAQQRLKAKGIEGFVTDMEKP
jgi:cell division septation protein DedD